MQPGTDTYRDIQMQLYESRVRLQRETRAALLCIRKAQKIKLVNRWKRDYPPIVWEELLRVARNRRVALAIADWVLEKP
jgi:hypothetical protein